MDTEDVGKARCCVKSCHEMNDPILGPQRTGTNALLKATDPLKAGCPWTEQHISGL
jgi:hypothetical protein